MGFQMAKRKRGRGISLPYTDRAFLPYATALGQLALAWNGLHESLAFLFCSIMGGGYVNQFLAIWHALKQDRAQREILLSALEGHMNPTPPAQLLDDIKWLCGRADVLEDARNDALHSPLWAQMRGPEHAVVGPMVGLGHVRAQKLLTRGDLLKEFRWCRNAAILLADFVSEIDAALVGHPLGTWPQRPAWPARPQPSGLTPPRRARPTKRPRPPRSSPA